MQPTATVLPKNMSIVHARTISRQTNMFDGIYLSGFSVDKSCHRNPLRSSVSPQRLTSNNKKHSRQQQQQRAARRRDTGTVPGWDTCCGAVKEGSAGAAVCMGCCCGAAVQVDHWAV